MEHRLTFRTPEDLLAALADRDLRISGLVRDEEYLFLSHQRVTDVFPGFDGKRGVILSIALETEIDDMKWRQGERRDEVGMGESRDDPVMCLGRIGKSGERDDAGIGEDPREHRHDSSGIVPRTHVPLFIGIIVGIDHDDHAEIREGGEERLTGSDQDGPGNTRIFPSRQEMFPRESAGEKGVFDTETGKIGRKQLRSEYFGNENESSSLQSCFLPIFFREDGDRRCAILRMQGQYRAIVFEERDDCLFELGR